MSETIVIQTGVANLASMLEGLARLGATPRVSRDVEDVRRAERVVLPGVGTFGAGMAALREYGLVDVLRTRIREVRPTLCVCLGMQMLAEESEESPGVMGLGVIAGKVKRFAGEGVRVPQMGWNVVTGEGGGFWAYFANSYRLERVNEGMRVGMARYGEKFVACVQDRGVVACQFHPELSGESGRRLMRVWLRGGDVLGTLGWKRISEADARGATRVIACLDVKGGRVVKGVKFIDLRDSGDPADLAEEYALQGADEIVMLDVSATEEERRTAAETVQRIRQRLMIPLTVGGGVRNVEDAGRLLDAGADKVSVNSAAVREPRLLGELAEQFGKQCTVVAIDAKRREGERGVWWEVMTRGGRHATGLDAVEWARQSAAEGAGEILLTSVDRDGTNSGYDVELLGAVTGCVNVPLIASGGAGEPRHLVEAMSAGANAVLAASIFHDGRWRVQDVKRELATHGVQVRIESTAQVKENA